MNIPGEVIETEFRAAQNGTAPQTAELPVPAHFNDAANAQAFVGYYGENIRYLAEAKRWLFWSGTRWEFDTCGTVENKIKEFARSLYVTASSDDAYKHAKRSNNANGLTAIEKLARTEPGIAIQAKDLDRDRFALNCQNGTIDLKTGELRPHNRADLITKLCPVIYNETAECEAYEKFLKEVQPDETTRQYLQKSIGYSLTGQTTERAFFILYGFGRNGKSVFIDLWSQILGDYARNTTAESLMKKQGQSIPNDIARLQGSRFVTTSETNEGERLNESLVKSLTGGDKITARFLFGEYFDFYFEGKLWIATNHKPDIRDQSSGMWDRVKLIPFTTTIEKEKAIDKSELIDLLMREAPGILAWAVAGCRWWLSERRLITPEVIQSEIDAYKFQQDSIAQFIAEKCVIDQYAETSNSELYADYKFWCEANHEFVFKHRRFSQNLFERGFKQRNSGGRYWIGIRKQ